MSRFPCASSVKTDMITNESIPEHRLITLVEGENIYHYDVSSLYRNYQSTKKMINPFTTLPLSEKDAQRVMEYGEKQKVILHMETFSMEMNSYDTIGDIIVECLFYPQFNNKNLDGTIAIRTFCMTLTLLEDYYKIDNNILESTLENLLPRDSRDIFINRVISQKSLRNDASFKQWLEKHKGNHRIETILSQITDVKHVTYGSYASIGMIDYESLYPSFIPESARVRPINYESLYSGYRERSRHTNYINRSSDAESFDVD